MRLNLGDDPAVILIASECGIDQDAVVGKLHRLWSWVSEHSTDGSLTNVGQAFVDHHVRTPGFAAAMIKAGWLEVESDGLIIPKFDVHLSESAKKRAVNRYHKANQRVREMSDDSSDKTETVSLYPIDINIKKNSKEHANKCPQDDRDKYRPSNADGKKRYLDWVYLDEKQLKRATAQYTAKGLTKDDLADAIRLLDAWFENNKKIRKSRTDDAKALIGWPLDEVLKRKTSEKKLQAQQAYADAAEFKSFKLGQQA